MTLDAAFFLKEFVAVIADATRQYGNQYHGASDYQQSLLGLHLVYHKKGY